MRESVVRTCALSCADDSANLAALLPLGYRSEMDQIPGMVSCVPWIPFLAIEFLEAILKPDMKVFEWGSGGSTVFFAQRVSRIVSIEHDREWYGKVGGSLGAVGNAECHLIEPEYGTIAECKSDVLAYFSDSVPGTNFKAYASAIDDYAPFDVVVIDGRARPSCVMHAHRKVRAGGFLLLDNSDRSYYERSVREFLGTWERATFLGSGPHTTSRWQATFYKAPLAS